jgi:NAD(P)-dependent dehydrogenase (short-subunit alcohol dehydrogenase family)
LTDRSEECSLKGRASLVTGASRNLGRAAALELARRGSAVAVIANTARDEAESVAEECRSHGVDAVAALCNLADPKSVMDVVREVEASIGPIDIEIACAAIRPRKAFLDMTVEEWDRVIATNLSSAFYLAKATVPGMVSRGWGRVIHVSGADGFTGWTDRAHNVTAKAGLHGFTKALAKEVSPMGVTVNSVVPGSFDTVRDPANYPDWSVEERTRNVAVRRLGKPYEFGAVCSFLAGDSSGYITGQAIHLNGGEFMF